MLKPERAPFVSRPPALTPRPPSPLFFVWDLIERTLRLSALLVIAPSGQPAAVLSLALLTLLVVLYRRPYNTHEDTRTAILTKVTQLVSLCFLVLGPSMGMSAAGSAGAAILVSYVMLFYTIGLQYFHMVMHALGRTSGMIHKVETARALVLKAYRKLKAAVLAAFGRRDDRRKAKRQAAEEAAERAAERAAEVEAGWRRAEEEAAGERSAMELARRMGEDLEKRRMAARMGVEREAARVEREKEEAALKAAALEKAKEEARLAGERARLEVEREEEACAEAERARVQQQEEALRVVVMEEEKEKARLTIEKARADEAKAEAARLEAEKEEEARAEAERVIAAEESAAAAKAAEVTSHGKTTVDLERGDSGGGPAAVVAAALDHGAQRVEVSIADGSKIVATTEAAAVAVAAAAAAEATPVDVAVGTAVAAPPSTVAAIRTIAPSSSKRSPSSDQKLPASRSATASVHASSSSPQARGRGRYPRLSPSLMASAFSVGTKRRQRTEAEAEEWATSKLQTAWRGAQGRRAANDEKEAKLQMWADAGDEDSERSLPGGGFQSLFLQVGGWGARRDDVLSTPQKLSESTAANGQDTERADRTPTPRENPGRFSERGSGTPSSRSPGAKSASSSHLSPGGSSPPNKLSPKTKRPSVVRRV